LILIIGLLGSAAWAEMPAAWEREARVGADAAASGDISTARRHLEAALELSKDAYLPAYERAELLAWVGFVRAQAPDPEPAIEPLDEAAALLADIKGPDAPQRRRVIRHLAQVHSNLCNLKKAEPLFAEFLRIARRTLPENDPEYVGAVNDMAHILVKEAKYSEAAPLVHEAVALLDAYHPNDDRTRAGLRSMESQLEPRDGELADARRRCLEMRESR